jgi:hypothetical protein
MIHYIYAFMIYVLSVAGAFAIFGWLVARLSYRPGDDLTMTLLFYGIAFFLSLLFGFGMFAGIVN